MVSAGFFELSSSGRSRSLGLLVARRRSAVEAEEMWHLARPGGTANRIGDLMIEQIEFGTRDEYRLAEQATERGIAAVVRTSTTN